MENLNNISDIIRKSDNILILPHIMPDGDTLGSSIALYLALLESGKNPRILLDEEIPHNLRFFIPQSYVNMDLHYSFRPDLAISVDCSDIERLGNRKSYFLGATNNINIDHHNTNTNFAQINYVNYKAAAAGEIIYSILKNMDMCITPEIATALYVAISTDTGSFKYDNTTPYTHTIAAELLQYGIHLNQVTTELYQSKPIYKVKLMIEALNSLEFHYSGKLGIISVTTRMMQKVGAKLTDADGLIEIVRDVEGIEVGVLLKEVTEGEIKAGFRAKHDIDVSAIAGQFGGGGHKKASGCTILGDIDSAKNKIIKSMNSSFR